MTTKDPFDHTIEHTAIRCRIREDLPSCNGPHWCIVEHANGAGFGSYARSNVKPIPQPVKVHIALRADVLIRFADDPSFASATADRVDMSRNPLSVRRSDLGILVPVGELTITPDQIEQARKAVADAK